MKRVFVLFLIMLVAACTLFAYGVSESFERISVVDEFGDVSESDFILSSDYYIGTYKMSSGKTGPARMEINLFSDKDIVTLGIHDQKHYDFEWETEVYYDANILMSYNPFSPVTVKVKFSDGTVKSYKGKLISDDIHGSGFQRMIEVTDLKADLLAYPSCVFSISNDVCSYTFKDCTFASTVDVETVFAIIGNWVVTESKVEEYPVNSDLMFSNLGRFVSQSLNIDREYAMHQDDAGIFDIALNCDLSTEEQRMFKYNIIGNTLRLEDKSNGEYIVMAKRR